METGVGYPGESRDALLDTYQQERRDHAKAMIDLSRDGGRRAGSAETLAEYVT